MTSLTQCGKGCPLEENNRWCIQDMGDTVRRAVLRKNRVRKVESIGNKAHEAVNAQVEDGRGAYALSSFLASVCVYAATCACVSGCGAQGEPGTLLHRRLLGALTSAQDGVLRLHYTGRIEEWRLWEEALLEAKDSYSRECVQDLFDHDNVYITVNENTLVSVKLVLLSAGPLNDFPGISGATVTRRNLSSGRAGARGSVAGARRTRLRTSRVSLGRWSSACAAERCRRSR